MLWQNVRTSDNLLGHAVCRWSVLYVNGATGTFSLPFMSLSVWWEVPLRLCKAHFLHRSRKLIHIACGGFKSIERQGVRDNTFNRDGGFDCLKTFVLPHAENLLSMASCEQGTFPSAQQLPFPTNTDILWIRIIKPLSFLQLCSCFPQYVLSTEASSTFI